ncbi:MAG: Geranylgeranyl diphosphate reductase, partial [uncultured Thermomicrobiales bacterium]
ALRRDRGRRGAGGEHGRARGGRARPRDAPPRQGDLPPRQTVRWRLDGPHAALDSLLPGAGGRAPDPRHARHAPSGAWDHPRLPRADGPPRAAGTPRRLPGRQGDRGGHRPAGRDGGQGGRAIPGSRRGSGRGGGVRGTDAGRRGRRERANRRTGRHGGGTLARRRPRRKRDAERRHPRRMGEQTRARRRRPPRRLRLDLPQGGPSQRRGRRLAAVGADPAVTPRPGSPLLRGCPDGAVGGTRPPPAAASAGRAAGRWQRAHCRRRGGSARPLHPGGNLRGCLERTRGGAPPGGLRRRRSSGPDRLRSRGRRGAGAGVGPGAPGPRCFPRDAGADRRRDLGRPAGLAILLPTDARGAELRGRDAPAWPLRGRARPHLGRDAGGARAPPPGGARRARRSPAAGALPAPGQDRGGV